MATLDQLSVGGKKILWVASPGGHLSELDLISREFDAAKDSLWVTSGTMQSRSILSDRRSMFLRYVAPRDWRGAIQVVREVRSVLKQESFDACVSTGAAFASGIMLWSAHSGLPTVFIESIARTQTLSATAKIVSASRRIRTYVQDESLASSKRTYFDGVWRDLTREVAEPRSRSGLKILVTLGTIRPYRFDRLVNAVASAIGPHDEVIWQLGSTVRHDLPGRVLGEVGYEDLVELHQAADVVVSHAGAGSVLLCLDLGISPVIMPRLKDEGEHVDDHQLEITAALTRRNLVQVITQDSNVDELFVLAANSRIRNRKSNDLA